jgi:hypothetical protein
MAGWLDPQRLRWLLWRMGSRGAAVLGHGGLIAAGVLIAGLLVWVVLIMRMGGSSTEAISARSASQASEQVAQATRSSPAPGSRSEATDPLRQRWQQWPLESSHSRDLDRLVALAQAQGVTLESGRVRRLSQADEPWIQIEMEVRMIQPWSQVRTFLGSALNRMPNLALQSVRLAREDAATPRVEAQLVLRWVYRAPTRGGQP